MSAARFISLHARPEKAELTKTQYHTVRGSMPPPFVQMAMVNAHARKMINAWMKWMMFFVRPMLPPDGRGSRRAMLMVGAEDCKGGFQPFRTSPDRGWRV